MIAVDTDFHSRFAPKPRIRTTLSLTKIANQF